MPYFLIRKFGPKLYILEPSWSQNFPFEAIEGSMDAYYLGAHSDNILFLKFYNFRGLGPSNALFPYKEIRTKMIHFRT